VCGRGCVCVCVCVCVRRTQWNSPMNVSPERVPIPTVSKDHQSEASASATMASFWHQHQKTTSLISYVATCAFLYFLLACAVPMHGYHAFSPLLSSVFSPTYPVLLSASRQCSSHSLMWINVSMFLPSHAKLK
jgi:hypothetical protein